MPDRDRCTAPSKPTQKRAVRVSLLVALAMIAAAASYAGTFNAYGPAQFTRATGAPDTQTITFDVVIKTTN